MIKIPRSQIGNAGYTLTELLVVLAIMGLLVALAPPILQSARKATQTRVDAIGLASRLEAAHDQAINTETDISVSIPQNQKIVFFSDGSATSEAVRIGKFIVSVSAISGRVSINERQRNGSSDPLRER